MRIQTSIDIDAPADRVWAILTDFEHYGAWNPLILRVKTVSQPRVGMDLQFVVSLAGRKMKRTHVLSRFDASTRVLGWTLKSDATWWAHGERVQRVESLGPGRCRYTNDEQVHGLIGVISGLLVEAKVRAALEAVGRELAVRAISA